MNAPLAKAGPKFFEDTISATLTTILLTAYCGLQVVLPIGNTRLLHATATRSTISQLCSLF